MNRKFRRHPVHLSLPVIDFTNEQIPKSRREKPNSKGYRRKSKKGARRNE